MESLRHEPILLSYPEKSLRKLPTFCFGVLSSVINLLNVLYNTITGWATTWPLTLGGVATVEIVGRQKICKHLAPVDIVISRPYCACCPVIILGSKEILFRRK